MEAYSYGYAFFMFNNYAVIINQSTIYRDRGGRTYRLFNGAAAYQTCEKKEI